MLELNDVYTKRLVALAKDLQEHKVRDVDMTQENMIWFSKLYHLLGYILALEDTEGILRKVDKKN